MILLEGKKVFVAMSGGVDSSVAAALLKEQGASVEGVTMCFSIAQAKTRRPSCCGVEGIEDARRAAKVLNIPHHVLDFAEEMNEQVIEDFVQEYLSGRTPNPCVRCNHLLKFGSLFRLARSSGADYLATGHYARLACDSVGTQYRLCKAVDRRKDQSYFLYGTAVENFARILFPLGEIRKEEVRKLAASFGLPNAEKAESQDICFVDAGGYQKFLRDRLGEEYFKPGPFVDQNNKVVGEHQGIANYTIGQRERLGIALGFPVYVYRIDKLTNQVFVGPEEFLFSRGFLLGAVNNLRPDVLAGTVEVQVRIRYNAAEVKAVVTIEQDAPWRVDFEQKQKAVTPGQSAVFFRDDEVLGGGVIEQSVL